MLTDLIIRSARFDGHLKIGAPAMPDATVATVVVGPNGSRKSLVLRLVCDAALGRRRHGDAIGGSISLQASWRGELPRHIICLSSTPYDRFPSVRAPRSVSRKDGTTVRYSYMGWRASRKPVSAQSSDRALAWALLRNRAARTRNKSTLEAAFGHVGLASKVYVYLEPTAKLKDLFQDRQMSLDRATRRTIEAALPAFLAEAKQKSDYPELAADIEYIDRRLDARTRGEIVENILALLADDAKASLLIDANLTKQRRGSLRFTVWKALIAIGVVEVSRTEFVPLVPTGPRKIPSSHLSSGQWNWLATFCGICTAIGDDSLLLIDEPENSLHPEWQRNYMQALEQAVQGYERCQIVVATHSPFIAAGQLPGAGDVVRLTTVTDDRGKSVLKGEAIPSLFGWRAADVYEEAFQIESTRDERFLIRANEALAAIRDGGLDDPAQVQRTIAKLRDDEHRLPDNDPMKAILNSIQTHLTVKPR